MSEQHDAEDILACVRAGRTPRPQGPYLIHIGDASLNFRTVRIEDPVPTGRQILLAADERHVTERMVFQVLHGWELEGLRLNETTDLRTGKVERFLVFKGAESFRFELDDRVLEWGDPQISGSVLKRLAGVDLQTHDVWLDDRGNERRKVADNESIRLDGTGLERFFTEACAKYCQAAPAEITITVNETVVKLIGEQHTGAGIKQAAIEAGVEIEMDFVLAIERGPGQTNVINDRESIEIKCGTRFQAIPDDDNS